MKNNDDVVLTLSDVSYLGSHPALRGDTKPRPHDLVFTDEGVLFVRGRRDFGGIPWANITAVEVNDRDAVEKRVTAARVLAFGILAWIAKKETLLAYLVIEDAEGEWVFAVPGFNAVTLNAQVRHLEPFVTRAPDVVPTQTVVAAQTDVADRLRQLSRLLEEGLVTSEEYAARRNAILDSL